MKQKTEDDAYLILSALCAKAEYCQYDMLEKMRRWELPDDAQARVMQRLVSRQFVDDERYTRAFVYDKVCYNKWGRRKIEQALWQKHIDEAVRQRVLDEVDDEAYVSVLRPLLKQKRQSIKASDDYVMNQKLIRFAMGRGFTLDIIRQCLDVNEDFDTGED